MKKRLIFFTLIIVLMPLVVHARSGCCSWHGGVCGCGCCDGTPLSSTCAPYYPSCSTPTYKTVIETRTDSIPFETIYTDSPFLKKGETTTTVAGVNGIKAYHDTVTYKDGVETSRIRGQGIITKYPTSEMVLRGTKDDPPSEPPVDTNNRPPEVKGDNDGYSLYYWFIGIILALLGVTIFKFSKN